MSSESGKFTLLGISVAISVILALSISITVNFYTINQWFLPQVSEIIEEKSELVKLEVNQTIDNAIDEFKEDLNITEPAPQPTPQPPVTPPAPQPTPQPPVTPPAPQPTDPVIPTPQPQPNVTQPTPQPPTGQPPSPSTPVPPTPPAPTPAAVRIIVTGDVEDSDAGNRVFNAIKAKNPNNVVVLGDLGYEETLAWYKATYGSFGNKHNCVIGNHDSAEDADGNTIAAEAIKFCGNSWYFKKNTVLFVGYNTNGDLNKQAAESIALFKNPDFMKGITSVHLMSHKGCAVPPNSHHGVEVKAFCDAVKAGLPSNVKVFYDSAHNHVMSASADGVYKQSGAGGRSHYSCPSAGSWNGFCNSGSYGYLEYTIQPDGQTSYKFFDYNGKVLYSK